MHLGVALQRILLSVMSRKLALLPVAFFCLALGGLSIGGCGDDDCIAFNTSPEKAGCGDDDDDGDGRVITALTTANTLVTFETTTPSSIQSTTAVSGLQPSEVLLAIDFRPTTGDLYGLGSTSRLYVIDETTGATTEIGTGPFTPTLLGDSFGFDFNPVSDRIRVVSDREQNLRLNPDTGAVAGADSDLAYDADDENADANPNIVGAAYTNNIAGAITTTLFGIDSDLDSLVRQGSTNGAPISPDDGVLFSVGPLGFNTADLVGFDIATNSGTAFAVFLSLGGGSSQLFEIDLSVGSATLIGTVGGAQQIRDIAVNF